MNYIKKIFNSSNNYFYSYKTYPKYCLTRNLELEKIIQDHIMIYTSGVHVLYLPKNTQKTQSTYYALQDLFIKKEINDCFIYDCSTFTIDYQKEIINHIATTKNISVQMPSIMFNFNNNKRSIIVLDQFESLIDKYNINDINTLILSLAHNAVRSNKYQVLININNEKYCNNLLLLNGGQKITKILIN